MYKTPGPKQKDERDPLLIRNTEKLTKEDKAANMQLKQQYVMINGRLQPALKYLHQIPMFNRYKIDNAGQEDYQEIVTYPTLRGDLKMKNRHQGVNYDDRHVPNKKLPELSVEQETKGKGLANIVKTLQSKNLQYNRKFYSKEAHKYERLKEDELLLAADEMDDPRDFEDIQKENMDLKEQMIH